MRHALWFTLATLLTLGGGSAHAQKVRPGLWENSISIKGGGEMDAAMARMRDELARMPPEQRRQMEAMMANRGMGMVAGQPTTVRVCVTPEQAARDELPSGDGRCRHTGHSRSGNTVRFKFTCQTEHGNSTGEGEFTLVSDTEQRGRMDMTIQRGQNQQRMEMNTTGKWLAADCGDVKPTR
jgi:hypothetical protein